MMGDVTGEVLNCWVRKRSIERAGHNEISPISLLLVALSDLTSSTVDCLDSNHKIRLQNLKDIAANPGTW